MNSGRKRYEKKYLFTGRTISFSQIFQELRGSAPRRALTLALFQPTFATDFALASSVKEGFGGRSTPERIKVATGFINTISGKIIITIRSWKPASLKKWSATRLI
jgi:hypothetical protein